MKLWRWRRKKKKLCYLEFKYLDWKVQDAIVKEIQERMERKILQESEGKAKEMWEQVKKVKWIKEGDTIKCNYKFDIDAEIILEIAQRMNDKKKK